MKAAEKNGYAAAAIPPPQGTSDTVLCRECGLIASNRTRHAYRMPLPTDMRPRGTCRGHGVGLFSNRGAPPTAFSVPGDPTTLPPQAQPLPPMEEGGIGRALRNIGRFIFGGE